MGAVVIICVVIIVAVIAWNRSNNSSDSATTSPFSSYSGQSQTSSSKYTAIFTSSYCECTKLLRQSQIDIPNPDAKFEIASYLYFMALIALIGKSKDSRQAYALLEDIKKSNIIPFTKHAEIEKRLKLYNDVLANRIKPRGDCVFGNLKLLSETGALGTATIVLGDILINQHCADNYEYASISLLGADEIFEAFTKVTIPVSEKGVELFNKINEA